MMKASEIISTELKAENLRPEQTVDSEMSMTDILPLLLDAPEHRLGVTSDGEYIGEIDEHSLLEGLSHLISSRDDTSTLVVEVSPSAYSASSIAHAVEDTDTHLVDLWSAPGRGDLIEVTLRVRCDDPSRVVASLERYGYEVKEISGKYYQDSEIALERLLSLQTLLNV